jgi:hypothetical protein
MPAKFELFIDLTDHVHAHAPTAVHHTVAELLDQAKTAFASGSATRGDLRLARPGSSTLLGQWQFTDDET